MPFRGLALRRNCGILRGGMVVSPYVKPIWSAAYEGGYRRRRRMRGVLSDVHNFNSSHVSIPVCKPPYEQHSVTPFRVSQEPTVFDLDVHR
jgi:hypothetical protein